MHHVHAGHRHRDKALGCWSQQYPLVKKSSLGLVVGEGALNDPLEEPNGDPKALCQASGQPERIAFTGEGEHLLRSQWVSVVNRHGGVIARKLSRKTTMLVCCRGNGGLNGSGQPVESSTKCVDAKKFGTKVVSEKDLWNRLQNPANKRIKTGVEDWIRSHRS